MLSITAPINAASRARYEAAKRGQYKPPQTMHLQIPEEVIGVFAEILADIMRDHQGRT